MPRLIERLERDETSQQVIIILSPDAATFESAAIAGTSDGHS